MKRLILAAALLCGMAGAQTDWLSTVHFGGVKGTSTTGYAAGNTSIDPTNGIRTADTITAAGGIIASALSSTGDVTLNLDTDNNGSNSLIVKDGAGATVLIFTEGKVLTIGSTTVTDSNGKVLSAALASAVLSALGALSNSAGVLANDGSGNLTWQAAGGGGIGTVTSVGVSAPTDVFDVSGSPVTSTGTLALTFDNQTANTVFAGPTTGSPAAPTIRALVAADIPSLAASIITSGILGSAYGGTGNGFTKFSGPTTSEKTFALPDASATLVYTGMPAITAGVADTTQGVVSAHGDSSTNSGEFRIYNGDSSDGTVDYWRWYTDGTQFRLAAGAGGALFSGSSGGTFTATNYNATASVTASSSNANQGNVRVNRRTTGTLPGYFAAESVNGTASYLWASDTAGSWRVGSAAPTASGNSEGKALLFDTLASDISLPGANTLGADAKATTIAGPLVTTPEALTANATQTWSSANGNTHTVTIGAANITVQADSASSPIDGQKALFRIKQNGSTPRTVTWTTGSSKSFSFGDSTPPTMTATVDKYDYFGFIYNSGTARWEYLGHKGGY